MKTVRWGMIGCGDVTERKSGPGFGKAAHSELVAVMRRNGALAADYARRHGVARWHDDADAIIRAPDIDAIYIATLTDSHCDYTLRCAAAGKPVYVEKPMGMNHAECLDMIAACRAAGVPLWVGYYRRALPRFLAVRDLIAADAVGEVRMVTSHQLQRLPSVDQFAAGAVAWRVNPALSGGGLFFEGACHTFDFLDFMFGPVAEVRAFAGNQAGAYRAGDIIKQRTGLPQACLEAACGALPRTWMRNTTRSWEPRDVSAFSTTQPVPIRIFHGDFMEELPVADPDHVHQPLIQTIVDELNGSGKCPSTGESAARTAHVMEAILADLRTQPAV